MSETKILEHVALMTRLNEQGVRAETHETGPQGARRPIRREDPRQPDTAQRA